MKVIFQSFFFFLQKSLSAEEQKLYTQKLSSVEVAYSLLLVRVSSLDWPIQTLKVKLSWSLSYCRCFFPFHFVIITESVLHECINQYKYVYV